MSTWQSVIDGNERFSVEVADCRDFLRQLPDGCVHCCVSSPPYFALRSYLGADDPSKPLEIGSEPTPEAFVQTMVEVYREVRRVLRDDGIAWLNLGDSFSSQGGGGAGGNTARTGRAHQQRNIRPNGHYDGLKPLDLIGIPWQVAFALRDDGWYLRCDMVWAKRAPMPESVAGWRWERCRVKVKAGNQIGSGKQAANRLTAGFNERYAVAAEEHGGTHRAVGSFKDERSEAGKLLSSAERAQYIDCPGCPKCSANDGLILRRGAWRPTRAHEYVFQLTKSPTYFADQDAVRTQIADSTLERDSYSRIVPTGSKSHVPDTRDHSGLHPQYSVSHDHETPSNPAGANPRDVWWDELDYGNMTDMLELSSEPSRVEHFASFPTKLVEPLIKVSTSDRGVCPACGAQWARVVRRSAAYEAVIQEQKATSDRWETDRRKQAMAIGNGFGGGPSGITPEIETLGWRPTCSCHPADPVPALVLDMFAGTATTLLVARRLGRRAIGCDLSPKYVALGERRLREDQPLFNGAG